MSDGMTKEQYIKRAADCAALLRKISDSEVLGDGTRESWACGIASNLLADLIEYKKREGTKPFNVETLVETIKEVAAVISKNGGAEIKALFREINEKDALAHIIIEPFRFISQAEREREAAE